MDNLLALFLKTYNALLRFGNGEETASSSGQPLKSADAQEEVTTNMEVKILLITQSKLNSKTGWARKLTITTRSITRSTTEAMVATVVMEDTVDTVDTEAKLLLIKISLNGWTIMNTTRPTTTLISMVDMVDTVDTVDMEDTVDTEVKPLFKMTSLNG